MKNNIYSLFYIIVRYSFDKVSSKIFKNESVNTIITNTIITNTIIANINITKNKREIIYYDINDELYGHFIYIE